MSARGDLRTCLGWMEEEMGPNARGRYAVKPVSGDDIHGARIVWVNTITSSVRIIQRQMTDVVQRPPSVLGVSPTAIRN